jgi:hypothetical protein
LATETKELSINMRTAIGLLYIFVIAIIIALVIIIISVPLGVQILAAGSVTPIIVLAFIFIYYCRKGKFWSFAGASILGAIGVILRVAISTQPSLEVGGGLPLGVTVLYIVLGALVSLKNYEAYLESRKPSGIQPLLA